MMTKSYTKLVKSYSFHHLSI